MFHEQYRRTHAAADPVHRPFPASILDEFETPLRALLIGTGLVSSPVDTVPERICLCGVAPVLGSYRLGVTNSLTLTQFVSMVPVHRPAKLAAPRPLTPRTQLNPIANESRLNPTRGPQVS